MFFFCNSEDAVELMCRRYFVLSKLIMLALSTMFLYAVSWISYGIAYSIWNKGIPIALTKGELAIIFLVAILQIWSYCSVTNLVGIFCRNQSVTMIVGFGWMVMEILLSGRLDLYGVEISAMDMLPLMVLQRSTVEYVWFSRTDVY